MNIAKLETAVSEDPVNLILVELFASGVEDDIPEYALMKFTKADVEKWQSLASTAATLDVDAFQLRNQTCTFYRDIESNDDGGALVVCGRSTNAVLVLTSAGFGWTSNLPQHPQGDSWCTSIFTFDELGPLVDKTAELLGKEGAEA
jgi:hypothetical protein